MLLPASRLFSKVGCGLAGGPGLVTRALAFRRGALPTAVKAEAQRMLEGNQKDRFQAGQVGTLPDELATVWDVVANGEARGRFTVQPKHMAPNGFMHAASVIALVDSACGYACVCSLPEGASGFTTIELKANYLGTAKVGEEVTCEARLVHGGRMTQVWDAEAVNATTGKTIAVFRCTQMVLWPR
jgi:1,4-dihydroxy-2-naphthoyl-CoA hydrolase